MNKQTIQAAVPGWLGTLAAAIAVFGRPADASADVLWNTFQNPPPEARASCYWWWKGKLTAGEMERQLHLLKAAGLGGAHIIPWGSTPAYLTPEWLQLLRAASDAARKEGMILDMSANATWPFRGDWVPEAESLHKVELETHALVGPLKFSLPARAPGMRKGRAKGDAADKSVSPILLARLAPDPLTRLEQMRDVTADFTRAGEPGVEVPAGPHTLYVVRLLRGLKTQAGLGRVPDHFNPRAIENYLKGFADRVAPALGGKLSNGLRAMYCDSIEISEANWTPSLPEEFKRRCGYDLMPFLPLVLGVDAKDKRPDAGHSPLDVTIARVRYDYCRTLTDLFLDGLAHPFYRWCHENGVLCRWQAYGWPWFYGIEDGYRIPDMPEGNNWLFSPEVFDHDADIHGWPIWQKYTSSGAHQAGRRIASTEAMTVVYGKFKETLDLVKRADDFNFACGINHSFLHGFCYSPADEPFPGRNQYGTYFSEQNPWWPYMRRWVDYNARLSAIFQSSRPVAQVALLFRTSDVWGQAGLHRHPFQMDPPWAHQVWRWINQNGANADYVSDQVLQQATFGDGKINFGPMRYDALIVLGARTLIPATAEALDRYASAGGRIVFVGAVPDASPGQCETSASDRKVREICQRLLKDQPQRVMHREPPDAILGGGAGTWLERMSRWRDGTSPEQCLVWTDQLLTDLQVRRSVLFMKPSVELYQIHYRQDDGRDLYFIANSTQSDTAATATFTSAGKRLERWDPEAGTRNALPVDEAGRTLLTLPPASSLLLVASEGQPLVVPHLRAPPKSSLVQEITDPWSVTFKPANGDPFEIAQFQLVSLHESQEDRLQRFAGQAIYRSRFDWNTEPDEALRLDLGEVPNCVTEVRLNGQPLGVRWYGRHDYMPGSALRQGTNELEVTVVTTLFNRLRKATEKAEPSGLLGPVTFRAIPVTQGE